MQTNQFKTDLQNTFDSFQKSFINQFEAKTAFNNLLLSTQGSAQSGEVRLKLRNFVALLENRKICLDTLANEFEKILHAMNHHEIIRK